MKEAPFLKTALTVGKIDLSLKLNQYRQIWLAQIGETHCSFLFEVFYGIAHEIELQGGILWPDSASSLFDVVCRNVFTARVVRKRL
jgi:hypothetical protein